METELLQNVEPADILAYARAVPTPADYLLTQEIIPETFINNVKYRIKSRERRVNAAKYRAYDASSPMGRREVAHQVTEGLLPPLGQKFVIGELETILLALDRGQDDQDLIDALYDDVERHVLGVKMRLELAAGDLLTDGKFTLDDENGLTIEADYGVDAGFLPTAGVLWSTSATATPAANERAWGIKLEDDGDGAPGRALASKRVIRALAATAEYKQIFYGTDTLSSAASRPTLLPGQVNEVRERGGLLPITEYDAKVRVDGQMVRVTPDDRIFLVPGNAEEFAETQYGITAEAIALSRSGNPRIEREDQPGIVVTAWEQDDPIKVGTKVSAVAMPVLYANDSFVSAKVL